MPSLLIERLIDFGIGYSLIASLLLALVLVTDPTGLPMPRASRVGGVTMLAGLAHSQWAHHLALHGGGEPWGGLPYGLVLVVQSAGFYWLLLGILRPADVRWHVLDWGLPLLPLLVVAALPHRFGPALAMAGGTVISLRLGLLLYRVRSQRRYFRIESRILALFGLMAFALVGLSFLSPALAWRTFAATYAVLISTGYVLVTYLLLRFPDVARKAEEAVATAYAVSTLGKVDIERALATLRRLFEQEHAYRDPDLSLSRLADHLDLSSHQLSELINTQLDTSFPRLVRQYRVEAAQRMLVEEPRASVLSIGLSVGFNSQSSFYTAFKDIAGTVPSRYRASAEAARRGNAPGPGVQAPE
ncbi:MAG: AraC family transcriptional regulator [Xanthomonadaceae bacterium]|nr:AraC family transcriptional regulator [Xanthomonadaceae bacterium]